MFLVTEICYEKDSTVKLLMNFKTIKFFLLRIKLKLIFKKIHLEYFFIYIFLSNSLSKSLDIGKI